MQKPQKGGSDTCGEQTRKVDEYEPKSAARAGATSDAGKLYTLIILDTMLSEKPERGFLRNSETQWSGQIFSAGECSLATFALKQGKGGRRSGTASVAHYPYILR